MFNRISAYHTVLPPCKPRPAAFGGILPDAIRPRRGLAPPRRAGSLAGRVPQGVP